MDQLHVRPASAPLRRTVTIPGSKSITNRALPLAALANGQTLLSGVLFADDTWQMINALQTLGYHLEMDQRLRQVRIIGRGPQLPPGTGQTLICGNSGTTIRFLAAMLCLGTGEYILDGVPRMRERPIDQLVDQLRALGADISYELRPGYPPIRIRASGLPGPGCQFSDAKSSQYISAVLMAAPYGNAPKSVTLLGPVTSEPYVVMTLRMMEQFGVGAQIHDQCAKVASRTILIRPATYARPSGHYAIEPDASNASYFLAAAALIPGSSITVANLGKNSLQGDVAFADVLARMGAAVDWKPEGVTISAPPAETLLRGIDLDMNHIPDMVQTLCIVACFAQGATTIRNVWNLRVKETDRLAALETELRKLGAAVETGKDWIRVTPPQTPATLPANAAPPLIATYDDHRMAMSFAIAGLRLPGGVIIQDPGCTAKTYPDFFQDLAAAVAP
jgi:3-phosphoshikimate 1-carboxyvinyltransferase